MAEPLLLPEPNEKYPFMIVGRYHEAELGFALREDQISDDEAIAQTTVRLRDLLVESHKEAKDVAPV